MGGPCLGHRHRHRGRRARILDGPDGEVLADIPASSLHDAAPCYDRPHAPPSDLAERRADTAHRTATSADPGGDLAALVTDTTWISSQYDHQLFLNTVVGPGGDAVVLRLKHPTTGVDTGRGLALTTDGNHRWCAVDPRGGTAQVVAEAMLNLACVGARPIALVNCLNFGDPEHPEVMWQLSEAIDGMAEACTAFGVPVVGGNVSLYNASRGANIDPTPVIGLLGLIDDLAAAPPGPAWHDGDRILLLDVLLPHNLAGSAWAFARGHRGGTLTTLDPDAHLRLAELVRNLVLEPCVTAVHDVSTGGLGATLAEMAIAAGIGATIARVADHRALFSEAPSRVVVGAAAHQVAPIEERAARADIPVTRLGLASGDRFRVKGLLDLDLETLAATARNRLPDAARRRHDPGLTDAGRPYPPGRLVPQSMLNTSIQRLCDVPGSSVAEAVKR